MQYRNARNISRRTALKFGLTGAAILPSAGAIANESASSDKEIRNPILGESGGLHHVAITTNDWERTLELYQNGLGFSAKMLWLDPVGPRLRRGYFDSGNGNCVEVFENRSFVPLKLGEKSLVYPMVHLCLRTTRLDATYENALKFGARVIGKPRSHTLHTTTGQGAWHIRLCFLGGPSGETIELLENAP